MAGAPWAIGLLAWFQTRWRIRRPNCRANGCRPQAVGREQPEQSTTHDAWWFMGLPRLARSPIIWSGSESRSSKVPRLIPQSASTECSVRGEIPPSSSRRAAAWPGGGCAQRVQMDRLKLLLANGARVHGGELTKAAFA